MSKLPFADKNLGQHFLINPNIIQKITEDFKELADWIIEIGPGPGILTKHLALHKLPFYVIDKDPRFKELLEEFVIKEQIFIEDALDFPLQEKLNQWFSSETKGWLVSNLPYNVSSPLLIKFLPIEPLKFMTLMFQKEVADKVIASENKNEMNSLKALSSTYFEVSLLCKVSPGSFQPPPKVQSSVLSFKRRENPVIELSEFYKFEKFLRQLFSQRRKQSQSVLKKYYSREKIDRAFQKLDLSPTLRAETFNLAQIHILYKELL